MSTPKSEYPELKRQFPESQFIEKHGEVLMQRPSWLITGKSGVPASEVALHDSNAPFYVVHSYKIISDHPLLDGAYGGEIVDRFHEVKHLMEAVCVLLANPTTIKLSIPSYALFERA